MLQQKNRQKVYNTGVSAYQYLLDLATLKLCFPNNYDYKKLLIKYFWIKQVYLE
jgi:hypothetical protein